MGFLDKAKDLAGQHEQQVREGIEKAGDLVDEHTGDRYTGQVDKGQDLLEDQLGVDDERAADAAPGRHAGPRHEAAAPGTHPGQPGRHTQGGPGH